MGLNVAQVCAGRLGLDGATALRLGLDDLVDLQDAKVGASGLGLQNAEVGAGGLGGVDLVGGGEGGESHFVGLGLVGWLVCVERVYVSW